MRLLEQTVARDDPDPVALACSGLLWRGLDHGQDAVWLGLVDGWPVSEVTRQFLDLYCQQLTAHGETAWLLVWDRSPWHRGEKIREVLAATPRMEVWQFPVATPELNPQEHVWKETREAVSHNHREAQLAVVGKRFEAHLSSTSFLEHRGIYTVCPRSN